MEFWNTGHDSIWVMFSSKDQQDPEMKKLIARLDAEDMDRVEHMGLDMTGNLEYEIEDLALAKELGLLELTPVKELGPGVYCPDCQYQFVSGAALNHTDPEAKLEIRAWCRCGYRGMAVTIRKGGGQ